MTGTPTVFVLDPTHEDALSALARRAKVVRWDDPGARTRWIAEADGVIVRTFRIDAPAIAAARRLKVIGKHGTGVEKIDTEAASAHGVRVTISPGANADAVVEHTMALALAAARRVAAADREFRVAGRWNSEHYMGIDLTGRTLGIIGLGPIGRRAAEAFRAAFQMEVLGYDPYLAEAEWARTEVRRAISLDDLLPEIDLLVILCPYSEETHHMIGARELALMRKRAILVNTARGGIVDEAALHDALAAGRLGGAGLDVFEDEPARADHPLFGLRDFVGNCHMAAVSNNGLLKAGLMTVDQVMAVLEGREPDHAVV